MKEIIEAFRYVPRSCVWELTLACNMRCGHCGSRAGERRAAEMSPQRAQELCHELAQLGCRKVTLSGGEPTLRQDWPAIARTLSDLGVRTNMVSNGWTWDAQHARQARDAGLISVCFSLDGDEVLHDKIRRPGSFAAVARAMQICRNADLTTASILTLNRHNVDQLDEVHSILRGWGVKLWQIQLADLMGAQRDHQDWALPPEQLPRAEANIARLMLNSPLRINVADNFGYFGEHEEVLRMRSPFGAWTGCLAGCQVVGIEADGGVKGCLSLQSRDFVEGNLQQQSLKQIWFKPGAFAYNRQFAVSQLQSLCADCRYREICRGGCSCAAHFASGTRYDNPYCVYRAQRQAADASAA